MHLFNKQKILVLGYIIRGPLAGMTWHYLNYVLGLRKFGHDIFYLEDSGDTEYSCYNPVRNTNDTDPSYGLRYANKVFTQFDLKNNWAYFDKHTNSWLGNRSEIALKKISDADVLINISVSNPIRTWLERIPVRIVIDTDPVFTQIRNLTDPARRQLCDAHTHYFTFGENYGKEYCTIPADGFDWKPARQPVFIDAWKNNISSTHNGWTTVMQWDSYKEREYLGKVYGMKSKTFQQYIDLPSRNSNEKFQLAVGEGPAEVLNSRNWNPIPSLDVSKSLDLYKDFIANSKGEFAVAKHRYAITNSGWFSERSACYLASGKPVIVQETGFSKLIRSGEGLLSFTSPEDATEKIKIVNANYNFHSKKALEIVNEYFDSDKVLNQLLDLN
jgi:hypothetical protein